MLTLFSTWLPLERADVLFARGLAWLSPKVGGQACVAECLSLYNCGTCSCDVGPCWTVTRWCDTCGGGFCDCDTCHGPPC